MIAKVKKFFETSSFVFVVRSWRYVPPWSKYLVRVSLSRQQQFGDNDWRANVTWSLAKALTWNRQSLHLYAMNCLMYGLGN